MIYAATSKRVLQIGAIAVLSPVALRRRLSHAGQTDQQHKAKHQQHADGKDTQRRVAGQRGDDRHQEGAHHACVAAKDIK